MKDSDIEAILEERLNELFRIENLRGDFRISVMGHQLETDFGSDELRAVKFKREMKDFLLKMLVDGFRWKEEELALAAKLISIKQEPKVAR